MRSAIVSEVKDAGYFSLSVDSTPDLSHIDEVSVVLRYVGVISCIGGGLCSLSAFLVIYILYFPV